jgi:uncharacterized membrane-anchored protein
MKKQDIYTLGLLFLLTLLTAYFSNNHYELKYIGFIILGLSGIKFLSVAFQFMELKKANNFWKVMLICYLLLFITITGIIVQ